MIIYSNIFIWGSTVLTFITQRQFLKSFTILILRKVEITIDFNGKFVKIWGVITH